MSPRNGPPRAPVPSGRAEAPLRPKGTASQNGGQGGAPSAKPSGEGIPPLGVHFVLPEPPSANRWWRNFRGRMVKSGAARGYQAGVAAQVMLNGWLGRTGVLFSGPVWVSIVWYRGRKSGDLDKRLGVLLDALQGSVYANDSQIVKLWAERLEDKANPRVEVTVCAV